MDPARGKGVGVKREKKTETKTKRETRDRTPRTDTRPTGRRRRHLIPSPSLVLQRSRRATLTKGGEP